MPHRRVSLSIGLREIYSHVTAKRRRQLALVLAVMFVGAFAEVATIGSVIPFLAILAQSHPSSHVPAALRPFTSLARGLHRGSLVAAAGLFAGCAIFAALIRLRLAWLTQDFAYHLGHELAVETQERILAQSYEFYLGRNSSSLVASADKVEILIFDMVLPLMQSLTAGVIAAFLITALLYIDPTSTLIATGAFVSIYVLVSTVTRKRLGENSVVVGTAYHERLKIEQESLGGIRDVIVDHSQAFHLQLFTEVNLRLACARASTKFISQAPRLILEGTGMVVLTALAVTIARRPDGIIVALPFLGALAVGAQRLLPLVQTIYTGWSLAAGHKSIVGQVVELLRLPIPEASLATGGALELKQRIRFQDVSFAYPARPHLLAIDHVSFDIHRGSMIAFTGETGSGKTTVGDLLMGLIEPTAGQILIDSVPLTPANARHWQRSIAHLAQSIFLADATIASNVALSRPHEPLDADRIARALRTAQLDSFVGSLPEREQTVVGEHGVRLSGGQRQRLGLARAIYKETPILVLDEPTSALDDNTAAAIIDALERLKTDGRTIVIMAHRLSTIARCDAVIRLHKGRVLESEHIR